jgi:hypothetical protein
MNRLQLAPDSIQLLRLVKAVMVGLSPAVQMTALQNGPFLSHIAVRAVLVAGTVQRYTALMIGQDLEGKRLGEMWIVDNFHGRLEENHRLGFDPRTSQTC